MTVRTPSRWRLSFSIAIFVLATIPASAGRFRGEHLEVAATLDNTHVQPHGVPAGLLVPPRRGDSNKLRRNAIKRNETSDYAEEIKFEKQLREGWERVSNTKDAAALRSYVLRKEMYHGLFRNQKRSFSSILFPGSPILEYSPALGEGGVIPMNVELVESRKTLVPYYFYDLPVCHIPNRAPLTRPLTFGSHLQGFRSDTSPFEVRVLEDKKCTPLCFVSIGNKQCRFLRMLVERQYRVHLSLDQLPVLMRSKELNYAIQGYPLGFKLPHSYTGLKFDELYLFNHLKFTITYHADTTMFEGIRITGFDVHAVSINHQIEERLSFGKNSALNASSKISTCNGKGVNDVVNDPSTYLPLRGSSYGEDLKVIYSYDVTWQKSEVPWSDRWDVYVISEANNSLRNYAIMNSFMLVLVLGMALVCIMIKTLRGNSVARWRLLHVDVFRPPTTKPTLLCVAVGTGAQIGTAVFLTLISGDIFGLFNHIVRGQSLSYLIFVWMLCAPIAGYLSSRTCKLFDASHDRSSILTAVMFPGLLFSTFLVLTLCLNLVGSSFALSAATVSVVFVIICLSSGLSILGSTVGIRQRKIEVPTKYNDVVRAIPEPTKSCSRYFRHPMSIFLGCFILFNAAFGSELHFDLKSLWFRQTFYDMVYLIAILLLVTVACAEVSVILCFLQLNSEDHRWWWRSFLHGSQIGFYVLLYSLWFLWSRLELVGVISSAIYLAYMLLISTAVALFGGAVGFLSCLWFNKRIYGTFKVTRDKTVPVAIESKLTKPLLPEGSEASVTDAGNVQMETT